MRKASMPEQDNARTALLIRAVWESLLAPKWGRDQLIDLGKLIYTKTPLAQIEPSQLGQLLPHLKQIATTLDERLQVQPAPTPPSEPTP
jgi:hypothetical protein